MTRWNLTIPEKTDRAVRTYLARTGGKKGDLSRFVDEAARRRIFDLTVQEAKDRMPSSTRGDNGADRRRGVNAARADRS